MVSNIQSRVHTNGHWMQLVLRSIFSLIGVILISMGAAFLKEGHVGLDPFTALNIGLAKHLGMSLGTLQLCFNILLFIIVLIADRHQIGIGTFFNMILVGYGIQFFSVLYQNHTTEFTAHIPLIIVDALIGIILFTMGTSFYMKANLGVAPYDAIAPILVRHVKKFKYQYVRSSQDILFMVAGILAGGAFGAMTIIIAFFAGPLINFWNIHLSSKVMDSIASFTNSNQKAKHVGTGLVSASSNSFELIKNIFRQTTMIEHNMSVYSNQQVDAMIVRTRHQLRLEQMAQKTLQQRYHYLAKEKQQRLSKVKKNN